MDPHAVLGVSPSADPEEVARAYREKAKALHPDRRPDDAGAAQAMATVNAAYSMLKDGLTAEAAARTRGRSVRGTEPEPDRERRPGDGVTDPRVRAALGQEVLGYLHPGERVTFVCDAATHESPRARIVVTDQRLVWLMLDAPIERVRSLQWRRIASVEGRVRGRLRKRGELLVVPKHARRVSFGEIDPGTLEQLVARVPA